MVRPVASFTGAGCCIQQIACGQPCEVRFREGGDWTRTEKATFTQAAIDMAERAGDHFRGAGGHWQCAHAANAADVPLLEGRGSLGREQLGRAGGLLIQILRTGQCLLSRVQNPHYRNMICYILEGILYLFLICFKLGITFFLG